MKCSQCHKVLEENNFFTLAKTHGKFFLVKGMMKGSFDPENLVYCENCAKKLKKALN